MGKRVLHIFPSFGIGGQQRRLIDLIAAFGDQLHHEIISLDDEISASTLLVDPDQVPVRALNLPKSLAIRLGNIRVLRAAIVEAEPAYLCTYNWGSIEAVLAWRSFGAAAFEGGQKPSHLHFEDGFGPDEDLDCQNPKRVWTRRLALVRSTIIVPSHGLETLALTRWNLPSDRVLRLGNGIDLERFSVPGKKPSDDGPVMIGSVGALRREKRFDLLIDTATTVAKDHPCAVTLVGDGPEMTMLRAQAANVTRHVKVDLPGPTRAAQEWYARFDIFMMSSQTEQMPISLMEAMAAGLPVVATNVGDIDRMVSEENKPFIVENGDLQGLSVALAKLVAARDLRQRLGAANQRKAMAHFGREQMITHYSSLFDLP